MKKQCKTSEAQRAYRRGYKAGLIKGGHCRDCGSPRECADLTMCFKCLDRAADYSRRYQQERSKVR